MPYRVIELESGGGLVVQCAAFRQQGGQVGSI